ncbi:unnamed protein product [Rotaria sordida]|uniref:Uncharacterized protein n=1 Tax=Rotaria sordida TaxID=392033 RepID=A0A819RYQ8_9BILA|nr:unnamed protein product [Rotaria sordida]CAF3874225.1 unnamed protein product [Rotaria sordida]CAF4045036.1 unnamed protein product [Rotaria sordida]
MNLSMNDVISWVNNNDDQISENEYLSILFDFCLQRFINEPICCHYINTIHFKEIFADALNWTNGFIAKLSGSRLTGLVEQYFVESNDDQLSVEGGDMDIMFEPRDAFVSDINTGLSSRIGFVERTEYPGFYYIEYNSKTKFHSTLQSLHIFEERNNRQYISSKKLTDLLHSEFLKYQERGPCLIEQHGPAVTVVLNDGRALQDFVFSLPMPKIPDHIREQWLSRSKQWPSIDVINDVSNSTCHLVPKRWNGLNEGEEDTLTWRLSLSFAEVLLTNSWNKKQRDCYLLLKSFVQELAPDVLSSHHIKTFLFTYMENNYHKMQQTEKQTDIFLDIIQCLSVALKSKTMPNYFISDIDMLRMISNEKCLYLAERLDEFYFKPVETIKQMTKNFKQLTQWSRMKIPLVDDYSKLKIYTWHLRSLLYLALIERDHLRLQCFEHIVELSNKYFSSSSLSSEINGYISNVEELLFTWLNIIITPRLRQSLPECFEQQQIREYNHNKKLIWLTLNFWEPIVLVFNIMNFYFDEEYDSESDNDNDDNSENERSNNDEVERDVTNKDDNANEDDDCVIIPFLKQNGTPTNKNDYNYVPVEKTQLENILEILIAMLCEPLLDLPSFHDHQYLIDRFHAIGIKNELLANAFYEAALDKSIIIFKLKQDLYSLEKNDPICVTITIDQKIFVEKRHDVCYEQMKNLFSTALQLSSVETWKIKVHMGYTHYFLFGYYDEAIDLMKIIIDDYYLDKQNSGQNALSLIDFSEGSKKCPILTYLSKKLNKSDLTIPTIVLAYYTLFQSYRMTEQWDNGQEYIEQFKQICTLLETDLKEDYDKSIVKLLLATAFICLALIDEACDLTGQFTEIKSDLANELTSLCGIQCLMSLKANGNFPDNGLTLELPYALSECGDENKRIHITSRLVKQREAMFVIRHGYDCYKMRSWLINEITILDELNKWISRLPVASFLADQEEET